MADLFEAFPDVFPSHPALATVWVARSLTDTIGVLAVLAGETDSKHVPPMIARFNRDLRELSSRLHDDYEQLASKLYPATGVVIGEWQGTCYGEIVYTLGRSCHLQLLFATNPKQLPASVTPNVGYIPIDPKAAGEFFGLLNIDAIAAAQLASGLRMSLKVVRKWFEELPQKSMAQLTIALLNEHRAIHAVERDEATAPKSPARVTIRQPRNANRDAEFSRLADSGSSDKDIAATWNLKHPNGNVSNEVVRQAVKRFRDKL